MAESIILVDSSKPTLAIEQEPPQTQYSQITVENISREELQREESKSPSSIKILDRGSKTITGNSEISAGTIIKAFSEIQETLIPVEAVSKEIRNSMNLASSLTRAFFSSASFLKTEFNEFTDHPIAYLRQGLNEIVEGINRLGLNIYNSFCSATTYVSSTIERAAESMWQKIKSFFGSSSSSNSESSSPRLNIGSSPIEGFKLYIKDDSQKKFDNSHHLLSLLSSNYQGIEKDTEIKERSYFKQLSKGIKKIASAILAKKEQLALKKKEQEVEETKAKLKETAIAHLKAAENLRPDLADEIDTPQTDLIFMSAFSQIPDVDQLIHDAMKKKAQKALSKNS